MQTTLTIEQVVNQVIHNISIIAPLAAAATIGFVEFAKKVGLPGRWAGLASYVIGFVVSILSMKLLGGSWFTPLSILVGILVAFGAPGVYSGIKAAFTKKGGTGKYSGVVLSRREN